MKDEEAKTDRPLGQGTFEVGPLPRLSNDYREVNYGDKGYTRHGLPAFYSLLQECAETHDKKSHDYASESNPTGNYHFAGRLALLFSHSEQDAGFIGRIGEKVYRLANLESSQKVPSNESIEDTERDIAVITLLWMADRRMRRYQKKVEAVRGISRQSEASLEKTMEGEMRSNDTLTSIISLESLLTNDGLKDAIDYLMACKDQRTKQREMQAMAGGASPQLKSPLNQTNQGRARL